MTILQSQTPYVYVLVRSDISVEQQIVQACHAALEAGFSFSAPDAVSHLIVLSVSSQDALLSAAEQLSRNQVPHYLFHEPDNAMGYSALATKPLIEKSQRRLFKKYPLLKGKNNT